MFLRGLSSLIRVVKPLTMRKNSLSLYKPLSRFSTSSNNNKKEPGGQKIESVKDAGREDLEQALRQIKDESGQSIMDRKLVTDIQIAPGGGVTIYVQLDQNYRKVKNLVQTELTVRVPWIKTLNVVMAPKVNEVTSAKRHALSNVKKIVAVASCKGGVGKSTVAVNLAFALHKMKKKVGIFDADIYGPSLPTLVGKERALLHTYEDRPKEIIPVDFEGVKTMSYGYATQNKRNVLRGPLVSTLITQLLYQTGWDELDYLVIDFPPGTGDIQLTLCQEVKFDGAVIVTTPQKLAFIDVVKGIEMFDDLKVPTISVVENMSYFECDSCHSIHHPFGVSYVPMLQKQFGIKNSFPIPMVPEISKYSDMGAPFVLTLPDSHPVVRIYSDIAANVDEELKALEGKTIPSVRYDTATQSIIVRKADGTEKKIKCHELRKKCGCALCIDEFTGEKRLKDKSIAEDVFPAKIEPKGNYAVAIVWSDGHRSSIYPYERLLSPEIPAYKPGK